MRPRGGVPYWRALRPSLIDSDFCRYELRNRRATTVQDRMAVFVKLPDTHMEEINCDSCEGPHSLRIALCTGNQLEPETSFILQGGQPPEGGVFLYNLYTRTKLPGIYVVDDLVLRGKTGTATLQLLF